MFSQFSRIICSVVSAAALAVCSNSVAAQDGELSQNTTWDGIFVGASVGAGITEGSSSVFVQREQPGLHTSTRTKTGADQNEVPTADVFLGLNSQVSPSFVAGLLLEASLADIDFGSNGHSTTRFDVFAAVPLIEFGSSRNADVRLHRSVSLIGRLGWLRDPTSLVYGLAGWTHGRFEIDLTPVISTRGIFAAGFDNAAPPIDKNAFKANGLTVGSGFEKKLGNGWSLLTEYRYLRFVDITHDKMRSVLEPIGVLISDVQTATFENQMHSLRIGFARQLQFGK